MTASYVNESRESSTAGSAAPSLGLVLVHHGDPAPTLVCLEAALSQLGPEDRLLVVDNTPDGEPPGEPSRLSQSLVDLAPDPRLECLSCPDNPGYGTAINRGVEALARARRATAWVALNHDVVLLPGFLDCARRCLSPPWGAAAGPQYLDRGKRRLWYAGGTVVPWLGVVRQSRRPEDATRAREVRFLPGACMVVLDQAWQQTGGFDPSFFLYHEDLDLCLRLRRAGWQLRFEPGLECLHDLGASTGSESRSPFYLEQMARTRLRPWPSTLHRLWLAALHTFLVLGRATALLLGARPDRRSAAKALLRGHGDALREVWRSRAPPRTQIGC